MPVELAPFIGSLRKAAIDPWRAVRAAVIAKPPHGWRAVRAGFRAFEFVLDD